MKDAHAFRVGEVVVAAIAFALLTIGWLDPLFRNPGSSLYYPTNGWQQTDVNLVVWILTWTSRALLRQPLELFDANIFHPAPNALAGSEHLIGYTPFFAPVYEMTGNPLLALKATILASFALAGAGMYALLRHWGTGATGAFFGGFVFTFFPSRVGGLQELQLLGTGFLPLSLLFLDRALLGAGRLRSAAAFAGLFLWQMLCSVYLAFIALAGLGAHLAAVAFVAGRRVRLPAVARVAGALAIAALVFAVIHRPYTELRRSGVIAEYGTEGRMGVYSNGWWENYVTSPRAVRAGGGSVARGRVLYVGFVPAAAIAALLLLRRRGGESSWAVPSAVALTVCGYVLGLGPKAEIQSAEISLPYAWLAAAVPGFSSLRVPSRFGLLMMTGVAALAGLGMGRLAARARPALGLAMATVALLATAFDYDLFRLETPVAQRAGVIAALPGTYERLSALPAGPVVEVPLHRDQVVRQRDISLSMYYSAFHRSPLILGYSGYAPPSAPMVESLAERLPERRALDLLCRLTGLRYVVVHYDRMDESEVDRWNRAEGLEPIATFLRGGLYATGRDCVGDLEQRLLDPTPWRETVLGTPLRTLVGAGDGDGGIAGIRYVVSPPSATRTHQGFVADVEVVNRSSQTWPVLAPPDPLVVAVGYRWEREDGSVVWPLREDRPRAALLPYDLEPGEGAVVGMSIIAPVRPGPSWLVVGVTQNGRWLDRPLARVRVEVGEAATDA